MMSAVLEDRDYRARLRSKGRLTLPREVRNLLHVEEGDELRFTVDKDGRVIIQPLLVIDPEQAWFWSKRWQRMEQEAQVDIDEGRVKRFESVEDASNNI